MEQNGSIIFWVMFDTRKESHLPRWFAMESTSTFWVGTHIALVGLSLSFATRATNDPCVPNQ